MRVGAVSQQFPRRRVRPCLRALGTFEAAAVLLTVEVLVYDQLVGQQMLADNVLSKKTSF